MYTLFCLTLSRLADPQSCFFVPVIVQAAALSPNVLSERKPEICFYTKPTIFTSSPSCFKTATLTQVKHYVSLQPVKRLPVIIL